MRYILSISAFLVLVAVAADQQGLFANDAAEGEPLPTWFNRLFVSPVLIALIVAGVGTRKLWERWRSSAVA